MHTRRTLSLLLALACVARAIAASDVRCTPPQVWAGDLAQPPKLPLAGDVDGDGYADLLSFDPRGKCTVTVSLNAYDQKSVWGFDARTNFGENALAAATGRFTGGAGVDVMAVYADGSIRLAHDYSAKDSKYQVDDLLGKLPSPQKGPAIMTSSRFKDGRDEAVIVLPNGQAWLATVPPGAKTAGALTRIGSAGHAVAAVMADFSGKGDETLVTEDAAGAVYAEALTKNGLGKPTKLFQGKGHDNLVAGDFTGEGKSDLVVGTTVLWDGNPKNTSEWKELAEAGTGVMLAADMGKRGRDDLVLFRREKNPPEPDGPGHEPYSRYDVFEFLTYKESDPSWARNGLTVAESKALGANPLMRCTSNDGLLDGWKVHGIPGFDLPKLGCSPLHRDVICEIQLQADVDRKRVDDDVKRIIDFYKNLPYKNLDGTTGLHFVPIIRETLPEDYKSKGWGEIGDLKFPKSHHGIDHWMAVYNGGGGQSSQMGDEGSSGVGAFWAVFIHEFGHQLGLDHEGFWPYWSPMRASLMSYSYSYSYMDDWTKIHYSDGRFKNFVLHENDLTEVLPFPYKEVEFLSKGPYRFNLKPDGPNRTLIDWNWNGVFGEHHVRANVHYSYTMEAGGRVVIGKTWSAPSLVSPSTNELLMFCGEPPATSAPGAKYVGAPVPSEVKPELKTDAEKIAYGQKKGLHDDMALVMRWCKADQKPSFNKIDWKWTDPVVIQQKGMSGDPVATAVGKDYWVFYPTKAGVRYRVVGRSNAGWQAGPEESVPDSAGMQGTPCFYNGRIYVCLFSAPDKVATYRFKTPTGWSDSKPFSFMSDTPFAAVVDTIKGQLVLACSQQQGDRHGRSEIRRFVANADGSLYELGSVWIEGDKGGTMSLARPVLLFDASKDAGPNGRLRYYHKGYVAPDSKSNWAGLYVTFQIADAGHNGGWLGTRLVDEWNSTRSAPGVAWFQGDIAFAYRIVDDGNAENDDRLLVGYHGLGIRDEPTGDFDEIGFIDKIGLARSIHSFAIKDAIGPLPGY